MQNNTIAELKLELAPFAILDSHRQYRLKELQQLATEKNIETQVVQIREKRMVRQAERAFTYLVGERMDRQNQSGQVHNGNCKG
jgi:anion-transporting  ArsA/GET3 family ATPase